MVYGNKGVFYPKYSISGVKSMRKTEDNTSANVASVTQIA